MSSAQAFLEEPGKTKIITLLNLGEQSVIANVDSGDKVVLNTHAHKISVCSENGKQIGKLPDDISGHLKHLIENGNEYVAFIKSCGQDCVKVFIREVKRGKDAKNTPSFSSERVDYVSFSSVSKSR